MYREAALLGIDLMEYDESRQSSMERRDRREAVVLLGTGRAIPVNNPVPVSLLSGDRKPQIRFLGNHHSGSGNLYHKSFRM